MPDTSEHSDQQPSSLGHYVALGTVEALLNTALALDPETTRALTAHAGTVIKLKIREPYMVFYLIIDHEGLEVRDEYPGHTDIRIITSLNTLGRYLLGMKISLEDIKLWGKSEEIFALTNILREFDLRTAFTRWLREHVNLGDILERLRQKDASWLHELTPIPGLLRDTLLQLKTLNQRLELQQHQLQQHAVHMQRQRRFDLAILVALAAAALWLPGTGLEHPDSVHKVILLIAFALLLSRTLT
ncbi:MAG: hypothetical protein HKM02_06085 [Pseudomonadales bacterium]|nr:hypothetical protein [Pseudomonadales bacterium]